MLKGKSLVELAQAVQDAASRKMDVVADTRNIEFKANVLAATDVGPARSTQQIIVHQGAAKEEEDLTLEVTPHTLNQITEHAGVPRAFAQRILLEDPWLAEQTINRIIHRVPATRMVRGMRTVRADGPGLQARAFLSNRYRRMEHEQQLNAILPELLDSGVEVMSTELTESKIYVKVAFKGMEGEVKRGDVVRWGFTFSNSEIGAGAMSVIPWIYRLICTNGLQVQSELTDARLRKAHLGRQVDEGVLDYLSDEAIQADDAALALKLRDTVRAFKDPARWEAILTRLRDAAQSSVAVDPVTTVERVTTLLQLPKPEANSVLASFLKDADYSKWGLANAITAVANENVSYDRAGELEALGGRIISLPDSEWRVLAKAA